MSATLRPWLILSLKWSKAKDQKSCVWYRPGAKGYTDKVIEAGLFEGREALVHVNGSSGDTVAIWHTVAALNVKHGVIPCDAATVADMVSRSNRLVQSAIDATE